MNNRHKPEELKIRILRVLEQEGDISQRELAERLGISLGKTNYCLAEIAKKGLIKIKRFGNSRNKKAYSYLLTPKGVKEKIRLTAKFLELKMKEYEEIREEIEHLKGDLRLSDVAIQAE